MDKIYTWLPFYKELSEWLLGKQNNQPELISKLKEIGITGFRDGTEKGKEITLQEIDPFTFLAYLNKFHSDERRVEILQDLRRKLHFKCTEPTDVSGIPTTHPMKVHLFPWKTIRGNNDINVLWELFGQVKGGKVDERLFQTALNIKSVGKGKLSIVLFYVNPERYVNPYRPLIHLQVSRIESGCYQYLMNHSPVYNYMPRMKSPTDVFQES